MTTKRRIPGKIQAFYVFLVVITAGLLLLISWGITSGSVIASVVAGAGLAVVIVLSGSSILAPDDMRSHATERTLRVASHTLSSMRDGLTPEGCHAVCEELLPEMDAAAICMTNTENVLAYAGEFIESFRPGTPNSKRTNEVIKRGHMETFTARDKDQWMDATTEPPSEEGTKQLPVGIIVPLMVSENAVGTIKLYYRHGADVDRTQLKIARGFGELISTQLSVYELDRQAELTAKAEVKALQAQINPHFLFNTLNTIASFTRTDPTRARNLLREFAAFYRGTLEGSTEAIPLSAELEQTRRYLKIEKARFGEDRIIESEDVDPACSSVMVPGFIVQPLVENAVRHAMREDGPLHISVLATVDGPDVMLSVIDDGLGMNAEAERRLRESSSQSAGAGRKGTGIALRNVADRIERYFGHGSGLEIMSKEGEGTAVTLRLAGAAPKTG